MRSATGRVMTPRIERLNEKVRAFMGNAAQLGGLWIEGRFGVGGLLTNGRMPTSSATA